VELVCPPAGFPRVQAGVGLAGPFILLKYRRPVVPVVDLFGQAILHRGICLLDQRKPMCAHLAQVLRHHAGDSVPERALLKIGGDPCAFRAPEDCLHIRFVRLQGPVIKVRRIVHVAGASGGVKFHVEHALADDAPLACARRRGVLQRMLQVEQQPGRIAGVAFVYQHRSAAKQIPVAFENQIQCGVEQRMAGAHERRERSALLSYERLFEHDSLVARKHRLADAD